MIIDTLRLLKQSLWKLQYRNYLPANYTMDDIFLVSYPKSGNTWVRFLIANALKLHYQIDREVNFFSVQDIIPGVRHSGSSINALGPFGRLDLPRIIKSHSNYNPYYCRVIFLVRDPRDVMVSFYHYLKSYDKLPQNLTLSEFIRHKDYGIKAWLEHTKSWYSDSHPGQIIQLFLYEDFMKNPQQELRKIMNLYGLKVTDKNIDQAVKLSSKENMRKSSEEHESTYQTQIRNSNFVREAKVSRGKSLCNEDRKYIEKETVIIAEKLGYVAYNSEK